VVVAIIVPVFIDTYLNVLYMYKGTSLTWLHRLGMHFFSSRLDILIHGIYSTMRVVCIIIVAIVLGCFS
jgi:hypothetical protein